MHKISYQQAIIEAMVEEMRGDEAVVLMGEDVGTFGGLTGTTVGIIEEFGDSRVLEMPISECGFVGASVGAALKGVRPIVEMGLADVSLVAMDQLVNSAAKMNYYHDGVASVSAVYRLWSGFRPGGGAQMSQSNEAMFAHVPGLKVVMPGTPRDVKGLLKAAIRDDNPVIVFEPKGCYTLLGEVPDDEEVIPLGQAEVKRAGADVSVIATGVMVGKALAVAEKLAAEGIDVEVVDPRTLRPLDTKTLVASACKTGRVVVAQEASQFCGYTAEIAALLADEAFDALKAPIKRVGGAETPMPLSPRMEPLVVPGEVAIEAAIRNVVG